MAKMTSGILARDRYDDSFDKGRCIVFFPAAKRGDVGLSSAGTWDWLSSVGGPDSQSWTPDEWAAQVNAKFALPRRGTAFEIELEL